MSPLGITVLLIAIAVLGAGVIILAILLHRKTAAHKKAKTWNHCRFCRHWTRGPFGTNENITTTRRGYKATCGLHGRKTRPLHTCKHWIEDKDFVRLVHADRKDLL